MGSRNSHSVEKNKRCSKQKKQAASSSMKNGLSGKFHLPGGLVMLIVLFLEISMMLIVICLQLTPFFTQTSAKGFLLRLLSLTSKPFPAKMPTSTVQNSNKIGHLSSPPGKSVRGWDVSRSLTITERKHQEGEHFSPYSSLCFLLLIQFFRFNQRGCEQPEIWLSPQGKISAE